MDHGTPPSALETAWRQAARTDPEPRRGLSVRRVVTAAIDLADREGLGAVSMSGVAAALGFTPMSLYRHVRSKEELLLMMQDVAVGPPPAHDPPTQWRAGLREWAWGVVGRFRDHPWVLQTLPMFGPPATPNQLAWLERGLRSLAATPLSEAEKLQVMLLIDAHVIGDLLFATAESSADAVITGADYQRVLTAHLDAERFPALLRAFAGGALDSSGDPAADRDHGFTFGLDRILDGVAHLIDQRHDRPD